MYSNGRWRYLAHASWQRYSPWLKIVDRNRLLLDEWSICESLWTVRPSSSFKNNNVFTPFFFFVFFFGISLISSLNPNTTAVEWQQPRARVCVFACVRAVPLVCVCVFVVRARALTHAKTRARARAAVRDLTSQPGRWRHEPQQQRRNENNRTWSE